LKLIPIVATSILIFLLFGCTNSTSQINDTNIYDLNNTITAIQSDLNFIYPNPTMTPGDILTTDANIVCVVGYTKTVRSVSEKLKNQIYAAYGVIDHNRDTYEMDHFIPLELGGSNSIKNLWPEPADPRPGFHEKDLVENYLHRLVCKGQMDLNEAQRQIVTDWYKVYIQMKGV